MFFCVWVESFFLGMKNRLEFFLNSRFARENQKLPLSFPKNDRIKSNMGGDLVIVWERLRGGEGDVEAQHMVSMLSPIWQAVCPPDSPPIRMVPLTDRYTGKMIVNGKGEEKKVLGKDVIAHFSLKKRLIII